MTINLNLGSLGPFMKAIAPALLALIGAGVNALVVGSIDKQTIVIAATGLIGAIITFLVPNSPPPVKVAKLPPVA
jgi:hypothetical protein